MPDPPVDGILPGRYPASERRTILMVHGERLPEVSAHTSPELRTVQFGVVAREGEARGALLFGGGDGAAAPNALFAEHFPDRPYRGETHGLLFSPPVAAAGELS